MYGNIIYHAGHLSGGADVAPIGYLLKIDLQALLGLITNVWLNLTKRLVPNIINYIALPLDTTIIWYNWHVSNSCLLLLENVHDARGQILNYVN